jgi:hypothetical protein
MRDTAILEKFERVAIYNALQALGGENATCPKGHPLKIEGGTLWPIPEPY